MFQKVLKISNAHFKYHHILLVLLKLKDQVINGSE